MSADNTSPTTTFEFDDGPNLVRYDRTGRGPGLLLIPGTGANRNMWNDLSEKLADRFTVVSVDLPGGVSSIEVADKLIRVADHAQLHQFSLVGHSMGAVLAAEIAATVPDRVEKLVLHAGWVRTDPRLCTEFGFWIDLLERDPRSFARYLPLMAFGRKFWNNATTALLETLTDQLHAQLNVAETIAQTRLDQRVDLSGRLHLVTAPTLVLTSRQDRIIDCAQQRDLVDRLANVTQAGLDAGHGAPMEDPEEFAHVTADFLVNS